MATGATACGKMACGAVEVVDEVDAMDARELALVMPGGRSEEAEEEPALAKLFTKAVAAMLPGAGRAFEEVDPELDAEEFVAVELTARACIELVAPAAFVVII